MHNSILEITNFDNRVLGTGFVVENQDNGILVVTCGHVVNDCKDEVFVDGKSSKIISNTYADGIDLALLFVDGLSNKEFSITNIASIASIASNSAKVIGFTKLLGDNKKEEIIISKIKDNVLISKDNGVKLKTLKLYSDEPLSHGYSGSPVICTVENTVIGVLHIKEGIEKAYAICSEHLLEFLGRSPQQLKAKIATKTPINTNISDVEKTIIGTTLSTNFDNSLCSFNSIKNVWVEPHLDHNEELNDNSTDDNKVNIGGIISHPRSIIIRSRQQYGATSLAHFLINQAWKQDEPSFWLYLDTKSLKPHRKQIQKEVDRTLLKLGLKINDVECVVLDEFSNSIKDANNILKNVSSIFEKNFMIVMHSVSDNPLLSESIELPREFEELYLWALNRKSIRQLVNGYNSEDYIEEENKVLNKVVADLDTLNIPRTPQNCLTILKISEIEFDDSPVNRTEMIRRVLFLLFNIDDIPHYKTRPDLKDTEFTLGYFCEGIIRDKDIYFDRDTFISKISKFCMDNEIELEVDIIFDVLFSNNIIVMDNAGFRFKFTYWVYYFAAHRMMQDDTFSNYILSDSNYISYPEIIEFYTGIDRRRNDVLKVVISDIQRIKGIVGTKCNFPEYFNIYDFVKWIPTTVQIEKMHDEISSNVFESNLPTEIKDEYADRTYDRTKPLKQNMHTILEEYSLLRLMKGITAASTALRNSDYASLELRRELLDEILKSWEKLTQVLVVVSPILAHQGHASIEGADFVLCDDFDAPTEKEKFNSIITCLPSNIIAWYVDSLFSKRMAPLINNKIKNEPSNISKHYLILLVITKKPTNWDEIVKDYIINEDKNSFYLNDILRCLKSEYRYSFTSRKNLELLKTLIKMTIAKHKTGIKKPNSKMIKRVNDELLPHREI